MTDSILEILGRHKGKRSAITSQEMLKQLAERGIRITDGELRKMIRLLTVSGRQLVCSSVHPPFGFYLPISDEEIEEYARQLKSRIREIAIRLHAIEREQKRAVRILRELTLPLDSEDEHVPMPPEVRRQLDQFYART